MAPVNLIVSVALTFSALLLIGLAIPLIRGAVRRNHWYGVRFRASFTSPEAWYAINRYGGWQAIGWSLPLLTYRYARRFENQRSCNNPAKLR